MAVACSSSCSCRFSIPPARTPRPLQGTPSLSPLSVPKPAPSSLHAPAVRPRWRLEPLPRAPHPHPRGAFACTGSSETEGPPSASSGNRVFVKGLPNSTSEGTLAKTFSQFGDVTKVKIITSKATKQSLGFGYVWFASEEDAQLAVKEMDGKFVDGRFIHATIARPESPTRQVRATPYRF